ncbi:hypothetical protein HY932_00185 [Candidatus Falkowbacteria bacterium]|nr:hypothetical protein [Candidatus Falkowbacteria bacterium]
MVKKFEGGEQIKVCTESDLDKEFEPVERKDVGKCSLEKAREILRENFYGKETIKVALGFDVPESAIPAIPFSAQDLEKAKQLGEMLVLRVSVDARGNPMTMHRMNEIMAGRMSEQEGKLLYSQAAYNNSALQNDCWYKNEAFFSSESLKTEWKLVSKEFVPNSTDKEYVGQTKVLRDYLKGINALTPQEIAECSDKILAQIAELMKTDWKEAAKQLVELGVNKNHRRRPVEILYDWILRFKNRQERGVLEGNYDWSCALSSYGVVVYVGYFVSRGACVAYWEPGHGDYIGVGSSR